MVTYQVAGAEAGVDECVDLIASVEASGQRITSDTTTGWDESGVDPSGYVASYWKS